MNVMKTSAVGFKNPASQKFPMNSDSKLKNSQNFLLPSVSLSSENLKAYFVKNQPTFGRLRIDHLQNGAYVDEAKNVFFKLFTFKNIKQVFVEIENKATHELEKIEEGIFKKKLLPDEVQHGDRYRFKLINEKGEATFVKDPYAMKRTSVLDDFSEIYDHNQYKWHDDAWMNNKISQKVSRNSAQNGLKPLNELKIYEINIATLTKEGDFKAAKSKIDELVKDGIFNTIEIMPVENTHSFNWGYDGVDKFAPANYLGGPDALKELIDYAHQKKLNVIMDVVPNHIGSDGNQLRKSGPYINIYANGPFGDKFNLEGDPANNKHVRDYLSNMCLNWLDNYHCDGLRLDMTKEMDSDFALKQIAMELHYHHPDAVLIAEDARGNLPKLTKPLQKFEEMVASEKEHVQQINLADKNEVSLDNLGFDSEWNFPFFHSLIGSAIGNKNSIKNLDNVIKGVQNRIIYPASHDEIGNMDGTRFISKFANKIFNMFNKVEGNHESEKGQRAAHATQRILVSKITGEYDKFSKQERINFLLKNHIKEDISPDAVQNALNRAIAMQKVAIGNTFAIPGPKMIFQGDEKGVLSYFKFFRKLSPELQKTDEKFLTEKNGYEAGEKAFMDSKLDNIPYSKEYKLVMDKIKAFTKDLSKLSDTIPALKSGKVVNTTYHDFSRVQATHLKEGASEIFTISNFKNVDYPNDYGIVFPKGKWIEVVNSNHKKYAGDGEYINPGKVLGDGENYRYVSIPANSLIVFKKIM